MVKVDIISGFLGAGKTTFIKQLLQGALTNEKVVLVENEFGEIGIDGGFLKETGIEIKEMNSGCICCSLVGDFTKSLKEVVAAYEPERIIIEPSGVGKLSDVVEAVKRAADDTELIINSLVTVVDAAKCKMYLRNYGEFFINQIETASTIYISRTDIVEAEKINQTLEVLKDKNPNAVYITTPVTQLAGKQLLEIIECKDTFFEEEHHHDHSHGECCCAHGHHEEHHHDHHAEEVFSTWGKETIKAYSHQELETILKHLSSENNLGQVLRAKGIVAASDQDAWYYFDLVPEEYEIRIGNPDRIGKLCVIGANIEKVQLEQLF